MLTLPHRRALLSGGGVHSALYIPSAVAFHPEVQLGVFGSALGVTNSAVGIMSVWLRGSVGNDSNNGNDANWCALSDMISNAGSGSTYTSESVPGLNICFDNASGHEGTARLNLNDATGGTNHSVQASKASMFTNGAWTHYIWAWDMGFTQGNKRAALYVNGVKQTISGPSEQGTIGSFVSALNSALGFGINLAVSNSAILGAFEMADCFLDCHTTGLLDGSKNLSVATLNAFYNNGPVYLGADGSLPLGSQPEVFFSGDKSTFPANRGSATGAIALHAPILTTPATPANLYNASYGPTGATDGRPYFDWTLTNHLVGQNAATSSITAKNSGNPIALGDLLIACVHLVEGSVNVDRAIQTPSGWTLLSTTGTAMPVRGNNSGDPTNTAVFWKIADAGDVSAAAANWATPPTFNWTTNANAVRSGSCTILKYKGANGATPIQAAAAQYNNATTTPSAPTVTPTGSLSTLLTLFFFYDSANAGVTVPPSGQDLRFKRAGTSLAIGYVMASDEKLTGTGATGTRVASQTTSSPSASVSIVIGP